MGEFEGIDETGENGDNRVALFSPSTLFPPFAKELPCILCLVDRCLFVEVKATAEVHPINKAQLLELHEAGGYPAWSRH
jgi:hypothetical protein